MGDTTTCVYQLIFDGNDRNDTKIMQYFIMHELELFINFDSFVKHMFHAC